MDKSRIETFSDSIFAIVMTLLIFYIRVPDIAGPITDAQVWSVLASLSPLIISYFLSFLVLAVFWVNHNFMFHSFMKKIDSRINFLNLIYLLFIVFIPFSSSLFGSYPYNQPAALIYGLNIFAVMVLQAMMMQYMSSHKELRNELSSRIVKQVRIRTALTEGSYVLGILFTFVFTPISIFFYLFPMIFNIIPGSLNLVERLFKFELT